MKEQGASVPHTLPTYAELNARLARYESLFQEYYTGSEHYRAIVDSSDDAIISKDLNGTITSWNKGAERIFGYTEKEAVGEPVRMLIPPELHGDEDRILASIRRGERIDHFETVRLHKNGGRIDISLTISPIKNDRGEIVGASKVARDITAQKRALDQLRESEGKFNTIFNGSPLGSVLADPATGLIIDANPAFLELTGFTLDEVKGRLSMDIGLQKDASVRPRIMDQLIDEGRLRDVELRMHHRSGRPLDVFLNASMITIAGEPCVLVHVEDISQRKAAEEALRKADRHKDEFLATLAHELRSPLAPLSNALQLLEVASDDPAITAQARVMMARQLQHMVRLIDDLMDVSRVSRGVIELRKTPLDLRTTLVQAIEATRPFIEQHAHQLDLRLTTEPLMVEGDATRLVQVFSNLLNNAAKYTDPGGTITVHSRIAHGEAVVSITDTGIGIEPEHLDRVFDMFAQLESALTRKHGGLGIGLNIVKRLVDLHAGSIGVSSAGRGRGSTFTVSFPLTASAQANGTAVPAAEKQGEQLRILVTDDNVESAVTLALMLRKMGHEVRALHNGNDAVVAVPEFRPHLVFMDIGMPHMDGYEACRRIRATEAGARAYLVALTGWGQDEDKRQAMAAGFDLHLVKPIGREALEKVLRTVQKERLAVR